MPEKWELQQYRSMPLDAKIGFSEIRIIEWYDHYHGDVYVSFSGGKDSTVLAHLVHKTFPDVPLVFSNTGLEYPEIQEFAKEMGAEFIRPRMRFDEVISKYGYPIISKEVAQSISEARPVHSNSSFRRDEFEGKRKNPKTGEICPFQKTKWLPLCQDAPFKISHHCCSVMKKTPFRNYEKETKRNPYLGTLTEESRLRELTWLKNGCNAFDKKSPASSPLSFWTEQDILHYIKREGLKIAPVYGDVVSVDKDGFQYDTPPLTDCKLKCSGCQRTGCIFCGFASHRDRDKVTRWQKLAETHPRQYEYCIGGGQWVDNPDYDPTAPVYNGTWKNWNPKKIWVPSKEGLGMKRVFDECNQIYGKDFIRYE